jgi:hypothetical protein
MPDGMNHPANAGAEYEFTADVHFVKAERLGGSVLAIPVINRAFNQRNANFLAIFNVQYVKHGV